MTEMGGVSMGGFMTEAHVSHDGRVSDGIRVTEFEGSDFNVS